MLDDLHVSFHALQLLQAPMERLQVLQQRRPLLRLRPQERRVELAREVRELVRDRVSEQRELLRGVQLFRCLLPCLGYDSIYGGLGLRELSYEDVR